MYPMMKEQVHEEVEKKTGDVNLVKSDATIYE